VTYKKNLYTQCLLLRMEKYDFNLILIINKNIERKKILTDPILIIIILLINFII